MALSNPLPQEEELLGQSFFGGARVTLLGTHPLLHAFPVYLIGTGKMQAVEDWDEDVSRDQKSQEVGASQEPILGSESVDLSWCPQDGYC